MTRLYSEVLQHLEQAYAGVFPPDEIRNHFETYVKLEHSKVQLEFIEAITGLKSGDRLLDMGCGYGSFVLAARQQGIQSLGMDIANFDISFAQRRITLEMPDLASDGIYILGDATKTNFPASTFDVVTAWNLLEHVPDYRGLIREAYRVLKKGGWFIGVAPNYLALRKEAHYQVLWFPMLPKRIGKSYLKLLGRNPDFLERNIFYLTNLGVLKALKTTGFTVSDPQFQKYLHPELILSPPKRRLVEKIHRFRLLPILKFFHPLVFLNPLKPGIFFCAQKT